jgi:hypothetical protein
MYYLTELINYIECHESDPQYHLAVRKISSIRDSQLLFKQTPFSSNFGSFIGSKLHLGLWGLIGYPLVGLRRKLQKSLGRTQELSIISYLLVA